MNDTLVNEVKELIISSLGLEDIGPDDIDVDAPLFGDDGLGLDSVDALELGLAIQKQFGLKIDNNTQEIRNYFQSVNTLSQFIAAQNTK